MQEHFFGFAAQGNKQGFTLTVAAVGINLPPAITDFLLKCLWIVAVIIILLILSRLSRRLINQLSSRNHRNATLAALLANVTNIVLIFVGLLSLISIFFEVGWAAFIASLGFLGAGIGLSLQDVLKNVWAGIYILIEQPYQIGDRVKIKEVEGTVERIMIRSTNLRTDSGLEVIVPNSIMFSDIVVNRSAHDQYLVILRVSVPTSFGLKATTAKIEEVFNNYQNEDITTKPSPVVLFENTAEGKINTRVEFWLGDNAPPQTHRELANAIRKALPEANISEV